MQGRDARQQDEQIEAGLLMKRKTIASTIGLGGTSTVIASIAHGPAGLFFGVLATGGALLLENFGTPGEYTAVAGVLKPGAQAAWRWIKRTHEGRRDNQSPRTGELRTTPYEDYLQTPEWRQRAQRIRARDQRTCQDCGARDAQLDVHHLTYERMGHERDEDLLTLCHACHEVRHGIARGEPKDESMEALQPRPAEPRPRSPQLAPPGQASLRAPAPARSFFTFSEILADGFGPSLQRVYLMTLEDGTQVFLPASKLCHVALAGLTRGGKSHLIRLLMSQLCATGAEVYHLDPHYTPYDLEAYDPTGKSCPEDWTPFLPYLANDPRRLVSADRKYEIIKHYLYGAKRMVDERMELRGKSKPVGPPVFLFLDELPAIVDHIPEASAWLKSILREGAKVGVNVVTAAQDFLVKTLFPNEGGAVRDCYRTVLYVGGDPTTAKILLDMPAKDVPENRLGKGHVMGRCDVVRPAQEARVPYVDNKALYALLGPSTYSPDEQEDESPGPLLAPEYEQQRDPDPVLPFRHVSGPRSVRSAQDRKLARDQRLRGAPVAMREGREQTSSGGSSLPAELRRAYLAYESQMSYRDLGTKLGVSKDTAGKWVARLRDLGYIGEDGIKRV